MKTHEPINQKWVQTILDIINSVKHPYLPDITKGELEFKEGATVACGENDYVDVAIRTSNLGVLYFVYECISCEPDIKHPELLDYPVVYAEGFASDVNFPNYNGGCHHISYKIFLTEPKLYYQMYIESERWRMFRARIFSERGFKCEICNSKKNLHIHHLTYQNLGNERNEDVMILCKCCHDKAHSN